MIMLYGNLDKKRNNKESKSNFEGFYIYSRSNPAVKKVCGPQYGHYEKI